MRVLGLSLRRNEEGAIAVLVGLLAIILVAMAAIAVDLGNAYATNRQLSVAADSAALTAATAVGNALPSGSTCNPSVLSTIGAQTIARNAATAANLANDRSGQSQVESVTVTCDSRVIDVTVRNARTLNTFLAGVIGVTTTKPSQEATGRYQRVRTGAGLRPWAVCETTAVEALKPANLNTTFATWLDNKQFGGRCLSDASGNWGGVDFNGGNNNAGDLAAWTKDGYPGYAPIPDPLLPADPGVSNSASLGQAFTSIVGDTVLFPLVTGIQGGGNNAKFNATYVYALKVCGIRYGNTDYTTDSNTNSVSTCWSPALASSVVDDKGKDVDHIQFRAVEDYTTTYVESGPGSNPPCDLTNPLCLGATQLYR
jgi:Flp pilus assembly protein TadG